MENRVQQDTLPIQPLTQTPVPLLTNWPKLLLFTVLGLIVIPGSVFIGIQIGKKQIKSQQPITKQLTTVPIQGAISQTATPTAILSTKPKCDYQKGEYTTKDCSSQVISLYKAGLPLGSQVNVLAGQISKRMSNTGMQEYRIYKVNAKIPIQNGLIWSTSTEADSEYMYIQEDSRLILGDLLGYKAANPDYAINNKSFQTLVDKLLEDYHGNGPLTIEISPNNLIMTIKAPENFSKTVRVNIILKTGEIRQIP